MAVGATGATGDLASERVASVSGVLVRGLLAVGVEEDTIILK